MGGFPQAANTLSKFKRSRTSEIKERDETGRGPMAPSGCCRRQSLRKCRRQQPCRRGTNYRLDGQVTITWTRSLSLPLFTFCLCFLTVWSISPLTALLLYWKVSQTDFTVLPGVHACRERILSYSFMADTVMYLR